MPPALPLVAFFPPGFPVAELVDVPADLLRTLRTLSLVAFFPQRLAVAELVDVPAALLRTLPLVPPVALLPAVFSPLLPPAVVV